MRILVVEDEPKIRGSICRSLSESGFITEEAEDGEVAWMLGGTEDYAAIILDIGLPKLDGLSVLRNWRNEGVAIPVLLLTAKNSWPEKVAGIDAGADDYLVKPFQMEELLARVRALVRRSTGQLNPIIKNGPITLDTRQQRIYENGSHVKLSPLEYRLLNILAHNKERAITQIELANQIYYGDQEPGSNAIEVLIGRVRKKFTGPIIETRRGFGYAFTTNSDE
jgi:two-component system OmpR family response regulator